jgi:UDP-N-acetyl-D-mannosaminuronate dehydrogenase
MQRETLERSVGTGLPILQRLKEQGAFVSYNDPYIRKLAIVPHTSLRHDSEPLKQEFLATQDCVLLVTDHSAYNYYSGKKETHGRSDRWTAPGP